jgi:hypothetical protein
MLFIWFTGVLRGVCGGSNDFILPTNKKPFKSRLNGNKKSL